MFRKDKFSLSIMMLFTLLLFMFPVIVSANSAEPPSLVILVNNPPDDLVIEMVSDDKQTQAEFRRSAWEGYYFFHSRDMQADGEYVFKVTTNGESFECTPGEYLQPYHNVVTLDLTGRKLTPGKYPFRAALLVLIRLLLTLLIEGIIFWLFGFRQKRSWLIFLAINLVTQGVLNIWLNSDGSLMPNYLILGLIFGEFFVFMVEMMAFPNFIREHKKVRILLYAFIANLISLFAGGFMITLLPV